MKATKKIVGAACALVAATALAAGSTFAWFSSNGNVSATGLDIKIKTDNAYLVIADTTNNLKDGLDTIELNPANESTLIKPAAYTTLTVTPATETTKGSVTEVDETKESTTPAATDPKSVADAATWYTAKGTNSDDGTIQTDENGKPILEPLDGTTIKEHIIEANFVISVSTGSVAVNHVYATMDVTVTESTKDCPIHVCFLYQTVAPKAGSSAETPQWGDLGDWKKVDVLAKDGFGANGIDLGKVESNEHYIAIKVMVYLDGNDTAVKTTNQANLSGVSIDFNFSDTKPGD